MEFYFRYSQDRIPVHWGWCCHSWALSELLFKLRGVIVQSSAISSGTLDLTWNNISQWNANTTAKPDRGSIKHEAFFFFFLDVLSHIAEKELVMQALEHYQKKTRVQLIYNLIPFMTEHSQGVLTLKEKAVWLTWQMISDRHFPEYELYYGY